VRNRLNFGKTSPEFFAADFPFRDHSHQVINEAHHKRYCQSSGISRLQRINPKRSCPYPELAQVCCERFHDYGVIAGDLSFSFPNIAGSTRLRDVNSLSIVFIGKRSLSGFRGSGTKSYFK
jgi:hypothetical protein